MIRKATAILPTKTTTNPTMVVTFLTELAMFAAMLVLVMTAMFPTKIATHLTTLESSDRDSDKPDNVKNQPDNGPLVFAHTCLHELVCV